jgi:hypothetical protein
MKVSVPDIRNRGKGLVLDVHDLRESPLMKPQEHHELEKLRSAVKVVSVINRMQFFKDTHQATSNNDQLLMREVPEIQDDNILYAVVSVLRKTGKRRTETELAFIKRAFMKFKFIEDLEAELDPQTFQDLFRELKLEEVPAGKTIFKYGDPGKTWYLILHGSVEVLIPERHIPKTPVIDDDGEMIPPVAIEPEHHNRMEAHLLKENRGMVLCNELHMGASFGEMSLRQGLPR